MNRAQKTEQIGKAKERFDRAISITLVNFQGLTVETVTALRREFKKAGVEYRVVKNTVIRHALKDSNYKTIIGDVGPDRKGAGKRPHDSLRGMTGVAWSYTDPAAAVKVVEAFKKDKGAKADKLSVKTGLVAGQLIDGETLGKMPGLKETQGMILGLIEAAGSNLYLTLQMPAITICAILDTWVEKQKAAGG